MFLTLYKGKKKTSREKKKEKRKILKTTDTIS